MQARWLALLMIAITGCAGKMSPTEEAAAALERNPNIEAAEALAKMGRMADPHIARLLRHEQWEVAWQTTYAAKIRRSPQIAESLGAMLLRDYAKGEPFAVRAKWHASDALGYQGTFAVPVIRAVWDADNQYLKYLALSALDSLSWEEPKVAIALQDIAKEALRSKDQNMRSMAKGCITWMNR